MRCQVTARSNNYVLELIDQIVNDKVKSAMLLERLKEENLLHIGHGDPDIDKVIETFKEAYGVTKITRYDRWAANRLVQKHGSQSICQIIRMLAEQAGHPYAPVPNNIVQIEEKWVAILSFLRKQGSGSETIQT